MTFETPRTAIPAMAAIAIAVALLVFHQLGAADVCGGNEAVEGVFVQQMVQHGKFLFPLENVATPMYKPPLFHWTAAAIDRIAGIRKIDAENLRFPSAMYAIAGAILTMLFAYGAIGAEGAVLAGLVLAASYQYIGQGRFGRVDMTLAFFETLTLMSFLWWLPSRRHDASLADRGGTLAQRWLLYAIALSMGLAVLSKGPVGAILPGLAIIIFMVVERRAAQIVSMLEPGPVIIGALTASSWYVACYFGGRYEFLNRQLGAENFGRFLGTLGSMAPWYYAEPLLLDSVPLSLLVPIAVATALARAGSPGDGAEDAPTERARLAVRLFAIFWMVTVAFFSVAAYKRRAYLLPLWPASAVTLAWWIRSLEKRLWGLAAKRTFVAVCAALIVFNFFYFPRKEVAACEGESFRQAAQEITRVVGPDEPLYIYGFKEEPAPLLFYLDRDAPVLSGRLGDAPPGYVIVPISVWKQHQREAPDLEPVLTSEHGNRHLVLLKRGKSYAFSRNMIAVDD